MPGGTGRFVEGIIPIFMSRSVFIRLVALCGMMAALMYPVRRAGGQTGNNTVLRGRALAADGSLIKGVSVAVTGIESKIVRTVKTNDDGIYTIVWSTDEGQFVVNVKAVGKAPIKQRVLRSQKGNVVVTDFHMSDAVTTLETVDVTANSAHNRKGGDHSAGVGSEDLEGNGGKLFSLDPSDVSALFQGLPGVTMLPDQNGQLQPSVGGQSPDQNKTTVDGMGFNGSHLPAGAIGSVSISKTDFDASHGGFAGGQIKITTKAGTNIREGRISASGSNAQLTIRDPAWPEHPNNLMSFDGTFSGPLKENVAFYNLSYNYNRRWSEAVSLLTPSGSSLAQAGLIHDTVDAASATLRQLGIPMKTAATPTSTGESRGTIFLNLTSTPTATTSLFFRGNAYLGTRDGFVTPTSYPGSASASHDNMWWTGIGGTATFGSVLEELGVNFNRSSMMYAPYLRLPGGTVLVTSQYADGRTGLTPLQFGGSPWGAIHNQTSGMEFTHSTSWLGHDSRHQLKLAQGFTISRTQNSPTTDMFGTYTYQTLADLAANTPTSYSRMLSSHGTNQSSTGQWISLGDEFRATDHFKLEYGGRFEFAQTGVRPAYNALADSVFGIRTDHVPHDFGFEPRLGFSWEQQFSPAEQAFIQQQAAAGKPVRLPISLNGGFGAFKGFVNAGDIAALTDQTGLPNTMRTLNCVGAAVPTADWHAFGADPSLVPTTCLDGTAAEVFSSSQPSVTVYDEKYHSPVRWSGNLAVNNLSLHGWTLGVNTDLSLNRNMSSDIDLNLRRTPVFYLASEGNRPMFISPADIVPTTGAVAPSASRLDPRFSRVIQHVSDLRSEDRNLSFSLTPPRPFFGKIPFNVTYTLSGSRMQARDEGGPDPYAVVWAPSWAPTHSIAVMTTYNIWRIRTGLYATLQSGRAYTPVINADINGSGNGSQRAFIFDPARTSDPELAQQMVALLSSKDPHIRDCLRRSLGKVAGYNSCRSGWQGIIQPMLDFDLSGHDQSRSYGAFRNRFKLSMYTMNSTTVIARALGLQNSSLIRATQYMPLDPTLLYVTGFDPATQQFKYRVNQQFGDNYRRAAGPGGRAGRPPFEVYFKGELQLGGPPRRSLAQGLGLVALERHDPEVPLDTVKLRLKKLTQNPMEQLLAMKDSLLLTEQQVANIKQAGGRFDASIDSLVQPVAEYVVAHGRKTDDQQLQKRMDKIQEDMRDRIATSVRDVTSSLTEEQKKKLPEMFRLILTTKK